MLKNISSFLILLILINSAYAQVAESNFIFAYSNIDKFIKLCLTSTDCNLNSEQSNLLAKISNTIALEKKNSKQLTFASEKASPGLFLLNDQVKVAKTFDEVGSTIFINKDMLYNLKVVDAIAILIHELGHHHAIKDETILDLLGLRVAFNYHQKFLQEAINEVNPQIKVSGYNYWLRASVGSILNKNENFDLLLSDNKVVENLAIYFNDFQCSNNIPKITHCDDRPIVVSSNLQNLVWQSDLSLLGNVTFICQCFDNSLVTAFSARKKFELTIKLDNTTYINNSAAIRIIP